MGGSERPEQSNVTRAEASRARHNPGLSPRRAALRPGSGTAALCPWDVGTWGGGGHAGHKQQSTAQGLEKRHYPDSTSESIIDKSQLAYSRGAALRKAQGLVFHLKGKEGKRSVSESQVKHGWRNGIGPPHHAQYCKQSPKGPTTGPQPRGCVSGLDNAGGAPRLLLSSHRGCGCAAGRDSVGRIRNTAGRVKNAVTGSWDFPGQQSPGQAKRWERLKKSRRSQCG